MDAFLIARHTTMGRLFLGVGAWTADPQRARLYAHRWLAELEAAPFLQYGAFVMSQGEVLGTLPDKDEEILA